MEKTFDTETLMKHGQLLNIFSTWKNTAVDVQVSLITLKNIVFNMQKANKPCINRIYKSRHEERKPLKYVIIRTIKRHNSAATEVKIIKLV